MPKSSSRKRLVVANWKMYVESPKAAADFARKLRRRAARLSGVELMLAPSYVLVPAVATALKGSAIGLAAQAISPFESGAHTGEVSAPMVRGLGASATIVGHSERRAAGESDEAIAEELVRAQEHKLRAILCVGEHRRDDSGTHFEFLGAQLSRALGSFPKTAARSLIIAYEPVWAIGKTAAEAMKPEELRETVIFIRKKLSELLEREAAMKVPVLYGGSVEPENASALIEGGDVAGFLVGHASAELESFLAIAEACAK